MDPKYWGPKLSLIPIFNGFVFLTFFFGEKKVQIKYNRNTFLAKKFLICYTKVMAIRFQRKNKNVEKYLFTYFMSKPQTMKILIDYKDCDLLED